ncbi:MAG: SCO family protein [Pseudomonadota bacterium]
MTRTFAIAAVAVLAAILGGIGAALLLAPDRDSAFAQCRGAAVAGDIGGPFELVSETGEPVTDETVITRPTLVYFGYTFCPDICPFDAVRNADAVDLLAEAGHDVQAVFISVDPGRDTPEALAHFTDLIHDDMLGLTGTEEQVAAAADAYRAFYNVRDDEAEDGFYLVDHSAFTYLVLPEHGFVDFFRRDASAADMATRTACFVDAAA